MKQLFLELQTKLAELTALKHIDKNWGQLAYEQPPVKFPCALLDIANVNYSQMGRLAQQAEGDIELTVATLRFNTSTATAASYAVFDIIDSIQALLHGWCTTNSSRLIRTSVKKELTAYGYEVYRITYRTMWREEKEESGKTPIQVSPTITVE